MRVSLVPRRRDLFWMKVPSRTRRYYNENDADDRHRLSLGGSEKIQLTALLGAFKVAVELSQKQVK